MQRAVRTTGIVIASVIALGASLVPPVAWLVFILTKSPNVPYTDEWAWADVLGASHRDGIPWAMIWQPYNGHRELVGNVLFLALDRYAGWSVPREQLVSLLLGTLAVLLIFETVRRVLDWRDALILTALASLLLCGPQAYETILLGYNMSWQLCTCALAYAVWALTARRLTMPVVLSAIVVTAVATFSSGQGLFIWPVGLMLLMARRRDVPAFTIALWVAAGAIGGMVYFAGSAGLSSSPAAPNETLRYLFTFVGVPLGWDGQHVRTVIAKGALLSLAFCAAVVYGVRVRRREAAPFAAYGVYALLGALSTTLARAHFGVLQATSPRYTAMSAFLVIAVVGLVYVGTRDRGWRGVAVSVVASLVLFGMIGRTQSVAVISATMYNDARVRELNGIAREDPATSSDADVDPRTLLRLLGDLRSLDDGPLIYARPGDATAKPRR